MTGSPADLLSRRCVTILKRALSADVWPNSDLKLAWFDKILITVEGQQPNFNNICTALELLAFLLTILVSVRLECWVTLAMYCMSGMLNITIPCMVQFDTIHCDTLVLCLHVFKY